MLSLLSTLLLQGEVEVVQQELVVVLGVVVVRVDTLLLLML
jgi:hypothetical protein